MSNAQLTPALAKVAKAIDNSFDLLLKKPNSPIDPLFEAMRYAAIGGGKRMRPLLVMASAQLFNVDEVQAVRAATAIEAIHVYSLIHDDLPCMDDDDLRHGKPTLHRQFDEATAVLAGDALHALAFEILSGEETHPDPFVRAELNKCLAAAAGPTGMAGGQMMDLLAETQDFDLNAITRLQRMKTGALIAASVEFGAILGHVPHEGRKGLRGYAQDVGLAFQIADDILDVEGDEGRAGKKLQKDEEAGKKTFVTLMGLDRAREQAQLLVDQAVSHLHAFGQEADLLRAIAQFTVNRDR